MTNIDKGATRNLVAFIRAYTDVLEKQLQAVRDTMRETTEGVMDGIQRISDRTAEKKKEANTVLVSTYTNPSEDAKKTMDSVQDAVAAVFDAAQGTKPASVTAAPTDDDLKAKLRRHAGFFSKHMEALETLDEDVQGMLLTMMGMLSRDDVISQRVDHVVQSLQAMQMSLAYVLVDFEARCRQADVDKVVKDLKSFTLRTYTTEEERQAFVSVFGEDKKAS